jgi:hypothetical protein
MKILTTFSNKFASLNQRVFECFKLEMSKVWSDFDYKLCSIKSRGESKIVLLFRMFFNITSNVRKIIYLCMKLKNGTEAEMMQSHIIEVDLYKILCFFFVQHSKSFTLFVC